MPSLAAPGDGRRRRMLEIRNLTKSFGGLKAIGDLSVSVTAGDFLGIIGPNRAGKTTRMNLVTRYVLPASGDILFEALSNAGLAPFKISHRGVGPLWHGGQLGAEMPVE